MRGFLKAERSLDKAVTHVQREREWPHEIFRLKRVTGPYRVTALGRCCGIRNWSVEMAARFALMFALLLCTVRATAQRADPKSLPDASKPSSQASAALRNSFRRRPRGRGSGSSSAPDFGRTPSRSKMTSP